MIPSGKTRCDSLDGEMPRITKQCSEDLPGLIAESVRRANAVLAPAVVNSATGREDSLTFNRRFYMKDGSIGWNPGKNNPNIIRPAGPIGPEVPVVNLATPGGKPVATYVNYALHLDSVGDELAWVGLPGKIFTELGMMIKLVSPFRFTIIAELSNGTVSYVPNRKAHPKDTYEVLSARCGAGSGELLVDSATKQLVALRAAAHAKK